MRVLVLALAVLLLPLRGWLGDAMALDIVQPVASAHAAHAMHDMGEMAHAVDGETQQPQAQPDCHSTCTHCQLCHSVALTVWPAVTLVVEAPREAPAFEPVAFASAEPGRGFKPPIS